MRKIFTSGLVAYVSKVLEIEFAQILLFIYRYRMFEISVMVTRMAKNMNSVFLCYAGQLNGQ